MESEEYYTGLKRDSPDHRDFVRQYGAHEIPFTDDHPVVDLRKYIKQVYNQGRLPSCAANALCSAYGLQLSRQAATTKASISDIDSSRLFVFFNAHMYDGTPGEKTTIALRDGLKAMRDLGVCRESLWPYDVLKYSVRPSADSYDDAEENKIIKYERLEQDLHQFRACLKAGFPIAFGAELYASFRSPENRRTGLMSMPSAAEIKSEKYSLHGVLAVGYDDRTQRITVLNCWGETFGDNGYFYMPYEYITQRFRTFDFWKVEKISRGGIDL